MSRHDPTRVTTDAVHHHGGVAPRRALRVTTLAGGVGGARFLRGLRDHLAPRGPAAVTAVVNTGDDTTLHGLRITPDLDSVMYTLAGVADEERGWGRRGETLAVATELAALGAEPTWFTLGDRDIATHLVRTAMLAAGAPASRVVARLCERFDPGPGVVLLPMSDQVVETHVELVTGGVVHFQEWWVRLRAQVPAAAFELRGVEDARPAPGVLEAIGDADVVLLAPSNPVVSLGPVLAVPGVREALRATAAPVVGVSPVIGGRVVRGMADACLAAIGVPTTAAAVGGMYADVLDAWLVDDAADGALAGATVPGGSARVHARPLLMDGGRAPALAGAALDVGLALSAERRR